MPFSELVELERDQFTPPEFSEVIPSFVELRNMYSKSALNKAVGEDLIHSRVYKFFPEHMARLHYPLVLKSGLSIRPALQWRGGDGS